jgi:hypothetical protein
VVVASRLKTPPTRSPCLLEGFPSAIRVGDGWAVVDLADTGKPGLLDHLPSAPHTSAIRPSGVPRGVR